MTTRSDEDLLAQAGAMTSQAIARQLGEALCAKTQAEAQAAVFHDELMTAREQLDKANDEIERLTNIISPPSIAPSDVAVPAEGEAHAVEHPAEDLVQPGSVVMLHPAGAPAAHPDAELTPQP